MSLPAKWQAVFTDFKATWFCQSHKLDIFINVYAVNANLDRVQICWFLTHHSFRHLGASFWDNFPLAWSKVFRISLVACHLSLFLFFWKHPFWWSSLSLLFSQFHIPSLNIMMLSILKPFFFKTSSIMSDSVRLHELYSPWNSPSQNAGVGSLSLLQGIFPTQGSNPGLPHCMREAHFIANFW